jgi:Rrf2 family protein
MKISTKGRYGLRIMVELALNYDKKLVSSNEISHNQEIALKYLETIINNLTKAGLIKTVRGSMGGHSLIKQPSEYTVGEILRVLEGSLAPVECVNNPENCSRSTECVTINVWRKISEAVNNVVDNITLQDLVDDVKNKKDNYYI